jgi:hypothetical protein
MMTTRLCQPNVELELSSYFEAELSKDPRVHLLARGVIARQSDTFENFSFLLR